MFYIIKDDKVEKCSDTKYWEEALEIEEITTQEYSLHPNKVIVQDGVLVLNPNYEEEEAEKEKERIGYLKCTKRVLVLMLQEYGVDYFEDIKPLIESNPQAQIEWELCVELQRNNPLLDTMGARLGITPLQLDMLFKTANGENSIEDLRALRGDNNG